MKAVFLTLVAGLVAYEFVSLANDYDGDTISEIIWEATTERPIVPFAAGVVIGHLFWHRPARKPKAPPA